MGALKTILTDAVFVSGDSESERRNDRFILEQSHIILGIKSEGDDGNERRFPISSATRNLLFVVAHNVLTFPPIRTKRMLRHAPQSHAALGRPILAQQSRKWIPVHHRLGTTARLFAPLAFVGRYAFSPILTFLGTGYFAVLAYESRALASTARPDADEGGGRVDLGVGSRVDGGFDACPGVAASAVGVDGQDADAGGGEGRGVGVDGWHAFEEDQESCESKNSDASRVCYHAHCR